ncbi:MAG TPA: hypothetical protein P5250_03220, partial [Bacteroidales bacterium]|nr:hypothetical protein [Bacteroidales bacterium]
DYRKIALSTGQILTIWNEYLGFDVWALFFSFIIAWPSKWKIRLLAIPIGSIILFFTNVLLISYVIKEASYLSPQLTMPSPNKFKFILYIVMAIMWIVYIKFFSDKNFIKHIEKFL